MNTDDNIDNINDSIDNNEQNKKDESSIYTVACSNSLEINELNTNKSKIESKYSEKDKKSIINNNNEKKEQTKNYSENYYKFNNYNYQNRKVNKKYSFQSENNSNLNITSSFSISDTTSFNNHRGSSFSFNSTKSSLLTRINNNLKKIKIDMPKKGYLNNRYLINNNQLLTPIEEKEKGTNGFSPSILSCENKNKNMNSNEKDIIFMRQTLEPKIKKFLFSPKKDNNIIVNQNININIDDIKNNNTNYEKESINSNISNNNLKKILSNKNRYIDSENEDNQIINNENINLENIIINEFNYKTKSKDINKNKKNYQRHLSSIRSSSSYKLGVNELSSIHNYTYVLRKTPSLNSTLNIKKTLKFDKITKISEIEIINIKQDEIDLNYLKKSLRTIPVKVHKISNIKNRYIKTLLEVQNFFIEDSGIWVMKLSHNYEYIATGSKNGSIKIFTILGYNSEEFELIYNKNNILEYFKLISEKPILELKKHTKDIIDLSWSPFNFELLLSASLDHYIILWDISIKGNNILKKFDHKDIITCVSFSPTNPNIFISGCLDTFIRIFSIDDSVIFKNESINNSFRDKNINKNDSLNNSEETMDVNNNKDITININNDIFDNNKKFNLPYYFNIGEIITSLAFFPEGNKIAIGTVNGKILVYIIFPKVTYSYSFVCRNKLGKYSSGKKVTSINFTDRNKALITTADSRIRYISMKDGKILYKYKGHLNINSMIRTSPDLCNDVLISGSENNFCYIWSLFNKEDKGIKNYKYEYFKPFARENIYCSLIIPEFCYTNYVKKIFNITTKINIFSVIINATDNGRLEVLLNVEEN